MIRNAVHFNGEDSEVGVTAVALQARVQELLANIASKKRKDAPPNTAPAKKPKLG